MGPINAGTWAAKEIARDCELVGAVPRQEIAKQYAWADVFVLPSICEGSATVCYEALASGLPVITTPNSGSVVRDGLDGFIVPIRNSEAIREKLARLHVIGSCSLQCRPVRASGPTLPHYVWWLMSALRNRHRGE